MTRTGRLVTKLGYYAGLGLLGLNAGCNTSPDSVLSAKNLTPVSLVVFAFKDGTLVDPVPTLPTGSFETEMIPRGRTRSLKPPTDYQAGEAVFLFIYQVSADRSQAVFTASLKVSAAELARTNGVVTIRPNIDLRSEGP
jgi:hypothetical protein